MSEKIVKYNDFDNDIKSGDVIVFLDDSRKTIGSIREGHKVTFTDDSKIDLFVIEIKGIIKKERYVPEPYQVDDHSFDPSFFLEDEYDDNTSYFSSLISSSTNSNYLTYQELFTLMESADKSGLGFSKYFWHYSTLSNLVAIVNDGKFRSRFDIEGFIPYDNKIHNPTSRDVMFNDASQKTKKHVRFYLRPLNKPYFALFKNLPEDEKELYCVCCIRKEALNYSFKSTFLYYRTAMAATDDVYDKSNELNQHKKERFFVNNLEKFDFSETYSIYDSKQSDQRSLYQEAEFLVWKELSFIFVDKIVFRTQTGLNTFLYKIRNHKEYNDIKRKCFVDRKYFGY